MDKPELYVFGKFVLNTKQQRLYRSGRRTLLAIPLRHQAYELLVFLLTNRDKAIGKEEIWKSLSKRPKSAEEQEHGCNVAIVDQALRTLRKALGDKAKSPKYIDPHPRGFLRFIASLEPSPPDASRPALSRRNAERLNEDLNERTYFRYRNENVDSSELSLALASRHQCEPVRISNQVFPVTIIWENRESKIRPDEILGTLDRSSATEALTNSPTLNDEQYAAARKFIAEIFQRGPIKTERRQYCMTKIDLAGVRPRIDGRFGRYYDHILTQYGMEWELRKAVKQLGPNAVSPKRFGLLPLREAVEHYRNPLIDGTGRCTAMTVSMLIVFARPEQGLWTIIEQRSKDVLLSPGMLHVAPSGMFEVTNVGNNWSLETALWRELLEEVYRQKEQQGDGVPSFDDDHILRKRPVAYILKLLERGGAEFSITGICCDLLNLRPEICAVLFVPDTGLAARGGMKLNWEYKLQQDAGTFGTPWDQMENDMRTTFKVGAIAPSGVACYTLARNWLKRLHRV